MILPRTRHPKVNFSMVCMACLLISGWEAEAGIPLRFEVLPATSDLNLTATFNFADLGTLATFVGQGEVGLGSPILSNGLSSQIGGWVSAYVDEKLNYFTYSNGTIFHIKPSGEWLPNHDGRPIPTDIGAYVDLKNVNMSGEIAMALRYFFSACHHEGSSH